MLLTPVAFGVASYKHSSDAPTPMRRATAGRLRKHEAGQGRIPSCQSNCPAPWHREHSTAEDEQGPKTGEARGKTLVQVALGVHVVSWKRLAIPGPAMSNP